MRREYRDGDTATNCSRKSQAKDRDLSEDFAGTYLSKIFRRFSGLF